MKKTAICILMCVVATLAIAAEKDQTKDKDAGKNMAQKKEDSQNQMRRTVPSREGRAGLSENRRQAYQKMLARRAQIHAAKIAELEAIKKIAEEEEAVRTVEAIQALITKKNDEYKERMSRMETQRRERAGRMQQRPQKRAGKPGAAKPEIPENETSDPKTDNEE